MNSLIANSQDLPARLIYLTSPLATVSVSVSGKFPDRAKFRSLRRFANGNPALIRQTPPDVILSVFETWTKRLRTDIDSRAESLQVTIKYTGNIELILNGAARSR
jgi:hypothetical protein